VETALEEADGALKLIVPDPPADVPFASNARSTTGSLAEDADGDDRLVVEFSEELGNPNSDVQFSAIETRSFSFNSPYGACPECEGIGSTKEVDEGRDRRLLEAPETRLRTVELRPHLLLPPARQRRRPLRRLASTPSRSWTRRFSGSSSTAPTIWFTSGGPRKTAPARRPSASRGVIVIPNLERRHVETDSERARDHIEEYMAVTTCPECEGTRSKSSRDTSSWRTPRSPR